MWHFFVKQEDNVKVFRRIYERFAEGKNAFKVAVAAADTQQPDAKKCYLWLKKHGLPSQVPETTPP